MSEPRIDDRDASANGHVRSPPAVRAASRNGHAPTRRPPPAADARRLRRRARVIEAFQETMQAFLDVQQATMLAYLGRAGTSRGRPSATRPSPATPPTDPRPERRRRLAAESRRLRVPGGSRPARLASTESAPTNGHRSGNGCTPSPRGTGGQAAAAPEAAEPRPRRSGRESIAERLVAIVRERTGYPAEMLGLDLDLEADLGIDSIKRVEILGTLRDSVAGLERRRPTPR